MQETQLIVTLTHNSQSFIDTLDNPDERICEEISFCQTVEIAHRVIDVYGKNVTKFSWSMRGNYEISAKDVAGVLNKLDNLKSMEFLSWKNFNDFTEVEELTLKNLSSVDFMICSKDFVDKFVSKILPKNSLETFIFGYMNDPEEYKDIFVTQQSIKTLIFKSMCFIAEDALRDLKLDKIVFGSQNYDALPPQFLKTIFDSQPNLRHLKLPRNSYNKQQVVDGL